MSLEKFAARSWFYFLLGAGALLFTWPFLWMFFASIKLDRETLGIDSRIVPDMPTPATTSPYIDENTFHANWSKADEAFVDMLTEPLVAEMRLDLPGASARQEINQGVRYRLQELLPAVSWQDDSWKELAGPLVNKQLVAEVYMRARRSLAVGGLVVKSVDRQLISLVPAQAARKHWQIAGDAQASWSEFELLDQKWEDLRYDFSGGGRIELTKTFDLPFDIDRFYRLEFLYRNDDSWNRLTFYVEKGGVLYKSARHVNFADRYWQTIFLQEPGPDDETNKAKSWLHLLEVDRGAQYENGPRRIRIRMVIEPASRLEAIYEKLTRNYRLVFNNIPFWRYVATSLFLVILNVIGTLLSSSLVAYGFARLKWPGRDFSFLLMISTLMVPPQVMMIPHFLIIKWLGWYNTLYPLWVGSFFAGAFNVFLLRQFMKGIPRDLEEAAKIDGCGFLRIYWHVMLPLVKPTLATIAIFTFMGTWNDFMGPLIFLSDQRLYPLSLGLYALNVQSSGSMGMMMAGSMLMTLPVVVIFFMAQKYFIKGVTFSGMKS